MAQSTDDRPSLREILATIVKEGLKSRLAAGGSILLIAGILLWLPLIGNEIAAKALDRWPGRNSGSAACENMIKHMVVLERVIPIDEEVIVDIYPAMDILAQGCEPSRIFTLNAPDFEFAFSPQREVAVYSATEFKPGVWILRPKKVGVFQVSIQDGDLFYARGISVLPSLFGFKWKYDSLITFCLALTTIGLLLINLKFYLDKRKKRLSS